MHGFENAALLRGERRMLSLEVVSVVTNRTYRQVLCALQRMRSLSVCLLQGTGWKMPPTQSGRGRNTSFHRSRCPRTSADSPACSSCPQLLTLTCHSVYCFHYCWHGRYVPFNFCPESHPQTARFLHHSAFHCQQSPRVRGITVSEWGIARSVHFVHGKSVIRSCVRAMGTSSIVSALP